MGIRQTLNENPVLTGSVTGGIILLALIFIGYQACSDGTGGGTPPPGADLSFFTTDDGKTYFADSSENIPPYTVNKPGDPNHGKTAYRVQVYKCGENGQPFVSHLEKYAEADKKQMEDMVRQAKERGAKSIPIMMMPMGQSKMLIKKAGTGDKGWVGMQPNTMTQFTQIMQVKCPDGGTDIQRVFPGQ